MATRKTKTTSGVGAGKKRERRAKPASAEKKPRTSSGARSRTAQRSRAVSRTPETAGDEQAKIAEAAYYLAEQRGFVPGHELEDWLTAEQRVMSR